MRDEVHGGYVMDWKQAHSILTDVTCIGWRVRRGQIAWDAAKDAPLCCQTPLVDPEFFWWVYDRTGEDRSVWAPPSATLRRAVARTRVTHTSAPVTRRFSSKGD